MTALSLQRQHQHQHPHPHPHPHQHQHQQVHHLPPNPHHLRQRPSFSSQQPHPHPPPHPPLQHLQQPAYSQGATAHPHQASPTTAQQQAQLRRTGTMPSAEDDNGEGSSGAGQSNGAQRPRIPQGLTRRSNSASYSRRPSSAPSDKEPQSATSQQSDDDEDRPLVIRKNKPLLLRSQSEYGGSHRQQQPQEEEAVHEEHEHYDVGARHGFEDHYQSEDIISQLANNWYMYYNDNRHETTGKPKSPGFEVQDWRMRDRLKTVSAALAVCLNIGVEPPDQLRTNPGAKLEAWNDPTKSPVAKALESIGNALQAQYETLSMRTRFKKYLDPSIEETKKFCMSLRRNAKDERVLLHYNGHGVPKPTSSGEIWVFNKKYTQYIPVSLYDLQSWLQAPTIFVWDCSEAGNILNNYHRFVDKHEQEQAEAIANDPNHEKFSFRPYIHLASCAAKENLPTNPKLPADLFTCCLTTPIEMALWFFVLQSPLKSDLTTERAKGLPGRLQERRTPLGELNWIFTAITDTIAWTTLPRDQFRKYFRQDLMVAALFRNFLLAQRIMPVYNCHPQSYPVLPDTSKHPLWESWDLAVDMALAQLPMLENKALDYEYQPSTFFADQLTAFEIYLTRGDALAKKVPEQLPVVLQVLLSQQHRVRALILLGRFLDLGPWAVQLALSIGIFPYVLKLLQSAAQELKPVMVFIWTRVLAVDITCQQDLIKESGYNYFASILKPQEGLPVVDVDEHKAMCAFILAMLCKGHKQGQIVCNSVEIMPHCLQLIMRKDNLLLRQWCALCISQLWQDLPEGKWRGIRENAHLKLLELAKDDCVEVRAAMAHAMTTFLGIPDLTDEVCRIEELIAWKMLELANDGSPVVRRELLVFLSHFVLRYEHRFIVTAHEQLMEEKEYILHPPKHDGLEHKMGLHYARPENREPDGTIKPSAYGISHNSVYMACWKSIAILSVDPHPDVQREASIVIDYVHNALFQSEVGPQARALAEELLRRGSKVSRGDMSQRSSVHGTSTAAAQPLPSPGLLKRTASYLFGPLMSTEDGAAPSSRTPTSSGLTRSQSQRSKRGTFATGTEAATAEQIGPSANPANYHVAPEPTSAGYEERSLTEVPTLPLVSPFLDWSIEYFREPQLKTVEAEEPGSEEYNERLWRRSRNEAIMRDTQPQKTHASTHKWSNPLAIINNGAQPTKMTFHQFESVVAVADDGNTVRVWDWNTHQPRSKFSNGNPEGSKISDMKFINEDDQALLMTGSTDGVLRIYRHYDDDSRVELASAFRALTHMVPSTYNSGMVFEWQQVNGNVLVAGDERVIRIWNSGHEMCTHEIPARSGSCVTSLTSDQMTGNLFVAGFGDGAVRVYDTRAKPQDSMVKKWKDNSRQWIRSVHMQRGGQRELFSASRNGIVKLWDLRMETPLRSFQTTKDVLRTGSLHEHLPVFAVGTSAHAIKVFNLDGVELSRVEPYSSYINFNQSKTTPITATAFHPHRMMLGAAAKGDWHINLFTCGDEKVGGAVG